MIFDRAKKVVFFLGTKPIKIAIGDIKYYYFAVWLTGKLKSQTRSLEIIMGGVFMRSVKVRKVIRLVSPVALQVPFAALWLRAIKGGL
jgi:hypothetical protein